MSTVTIKKTGITETGCEAVVNAANSHLSAGGGVCGAIFRAAGPNELTKACSQIGYCDTGSAVITDGFHLSRYIIHAVGPVWKGESDEPELLYNAYKKALELCKENKIRNVAFPLISAGIYGYPVAGAWERAMQACYDFMEKYQDYDIDIVFAVIDTDILEAGKKAQSKRKKYASIENDIEMRGPKILSDMHEARIKVFNDTKFMYENDPYLSKAVYDSKNATVLYEGNAELQIKREEKNTVIIVTKNRTFEAAKKQKEAHPDKRIAVLNFASAVSPGGGVLHGMSAQEECLCRCSTLFPVLNCKTLRDQYYTPNRNRSDRTNTDVVIYSPDIVVFKTDTNLPERMSDKEWYKVDVLTCAAPDLRGNTFDARMIYDLHVKRAKQILKVAAANSADILILGAFGCGAFKNDPEVVAKAYKDVLNKHNYGFEMIEFAVYCSPRDEHNYKAFEETFE